jgi:hypothetical protein
MSSRLTDRRKEGQVTSGGGSIIGRPADEVFAFVGDAEARYIPTQESLR